MEIRGQKGGGAKVEERAVEEISRACRNYRRLLGVMMDGVECGR